MPKVIISSFVTEMVWAQFEAMHPVSTLRTSPKMLLCDMQWMGVLQQEKGAQNWWSFWLMEAYETRMVNMVDVSISSAYLDCWRGESDQRWTLVYTSHSLHKRSVTYQFCVNSAEDIFWVLAQTGNASNFWRRKCLGYGQFSWYCNT